MRLRFCFFILSFMSTVVSQEVKSSVEFYDTIANEKTGEIGWIGNAVNGSFFIDANGQKRLLIKNDTTTITGQVRATSFAGDGSRLTGIVSGSAIADSSKKIPDGSVTNAKLSASIKIKDENIDSINWSKIKGIPAGFADGIDNISTGATALDSVRAASIADSCKRIPKISMVDSAKFTLRAVTADSARAASIADSCKKIPKIFMIDSSKFTLRAVTADSARAALIADSCKKIPKITKVDSAKFALRADSLGTQPASKYALKTDVSNSMGIAFSEDHIRERLQKYTLSTIPSSYNSITITVPEAGYIFVSAFAEFQCESNSGMVTFGMISDVAPGTENYGGYSVMSLIKPDSTVNQATLNYSQSRVFYISSPGTYTYKLYAWRYESSGPASMYNNSVSAIYIKTLMGTAVVK